MSIQLLGFIASIIFPTVGALAWLQDKSNKRIDTILERSNERVDLVLLHVQPVEKTLNDMRADLPTKYTLRDDYLRLVERVDTLAFEVGSCKREIKSLEEKPNDA